MIHLHAGWTEPINDQLFADGVAVNLTGMTVAIVIQDAAGNTLSVAGTVSIPDPTNGKVRFAPNSGAITAVGSPWRVLWRVTSAGKDAYFPSEGYIRWSIT